jgi:bromodomain-containing protein 8
VAGSESNAATPTADRKRTLKDDPRHKSWQKNINLLWREIANHKNGAMFMNPIKESIAPHYYEIIKRPMDLKTIKNRIRDGVRTSIKKKKL